MPRLSVKEQTITLGEFALIVGVSMQAARDYLRKGMFEDVTPGRYSLVDSVNAWAAQQKKAAFGRSDDSARTQLSLAQAALARSKAGVMTGKLVDVDEMRAETDAEWRKLRGLMLALPTRIGNQAVALPRTTMNLIEQEVRDVLTEMAYADFEFQYRAFFTRTAEEGMAESATPAAEATAEHVDRRDHPPAKRRKALPGRVRLYPYHRSIADAITDPALERITMVKAARVGFTTLLTGAVGSYVVNEPSPILALLPTVDDCRDYMVVDAKPIFEVPSALRPAPCRALLATRSWRSSVRRSRTRTRR